MPYIEVKTNTALSSEKEVTLKSEIAEILASSFPGKTENWLMIDFTDKVRMYFAGESTPCAMIEIALFGHGSDKSYDKMTSGICALIEKELEIPQDRVYVKYTEIDHWGWNGSNF